VDLTWPVSGLPRILRLDNAKEFRSLAPAAGVAQYGIDLQYRPPATPHWGGHIERLIGTMMGAVRLLPGATGRSVADRRQDPEARAAMTLDEFETWLLHQVAGVYHHSVHRILGRRPSRHGMRHSLVQNANSSIHPKPIGSCSISCRSENARSYGLEFQSSRSPIRMVSYQHSPSGEASGSL
jgi:hypothetical protein